MAKAMWHLALATARSVWSCWCTVHCREATPVLPYICPWDNWKRWLASFCHTLSSVLTLKSPRHCVEQYELVQNDFVYHGWVHSWRLRRTLLLSLATVRKSASLQTSWRIIRHRVGDTVKRRIIGYLGHDGQTGCGAKFTNIRVVCQNTLLLLSMTAVHASITHKQGANGDFQSSRPSIDTARQDFVIECDLCEFLASPSVLPTSTILWTRSIHWPRYYVRKRETWACL